jgi:hypothetical protein
MTEGQEVLIVATMVFGCFGLVIPTVGAAIAVFDSYRYHADWCPAWLIGICSGEEWPPEDDA